MEKILMISILLNVVGLILLGIWERVFRKQNGEIEIYKIKERNYEEIIAELDKDVDRFRVINREQKESIIIKDKTIKFLSEQNIILNDELKNTTFSYADESEILKAARIKKEYQKFLIRLQTSK